MARERDNGAGVSAARCYSPAPKNARQVTASGGRISNGSGERKPSSADAGPPFGASTGRQ
jgi:hypothetical protein